MARTGTSGWTALLSLAIGVPKAARAVLGRIASGCCPESGCHDRLTAMPVAEPRSSLDTPDPSSAGASASNRHPLHLVYDVQRVCF